MSGERVVESPNGKKTVSLVLYVITVLILFISNAVAVTIAIMSRPTEEKVEHMIDKELGEHSYIGGELKHIHEQMNRNANDISDIKKKLKIE